LKFADSINEDKKLKKCAKKLGPELRHSDDWAVDIPAYGSLPIKTDGKSEY
jgi:hypothetical protein